MRLKDYALFLLLLGAAALAGWFLPLLVTKGFDRSVEGKAEPAPIQQVDLRFQSDLDIADRLRLVREEFTPAEVIELERGIQLTEQDAMEITEQFLENLTGAPLSTREEACSVSPALLCFERSGSFLVWYVNVLLNDSWTCSAVLDDQTGLVLQCEISGSERGMDSLFQGLSTASDARSYLFSALKNALLSHCRLRLSKELSLRAELEAFEPDGYFGPLLFMENGQNAFEMRILLIIPDGFLKIN